MLNFLFIVLFIQVFQHFFGADNSVIAIILTILMGICAGRDVTASPVKHFLLQFLLFAFLATAACFSVALGPWLAIPINLVATFVVLYAYTYEYSHHLYFPYLLSYLFLLYISPVPPTGLPLRLGAIAVGSACMVLYALVLCYRNLRKPVRRDLAALLDEARLAADSAEGESAAADREPAVRRILYRLSKNADDRRLGPYRFPESALAALDAGRGLENLILCLRGAARQNLEAGAKEALLGAIDDLQVYLRKPARGIPEWTQTPFTDNETTRQLYDNLCFVRRRLLDLRRRSPRRREPSALSLSTRLKSALGYSPVRLVYALRAAVLLTVFIVPVQFLHLAHGKWLLFTLASVSLPYAEDVLPKARKRFLATILGGAAGWILFSLSPDPTYRTAVMMASGYLSFYFSDYLGNYACATVGALGGAVFAGAVGWGEVGAMFGLRLAYILLGIGIACAANLLVCPFHRRRASENIYRQYRRTGELLADLSDLRLDRQSYYGLVIHNNLLEQKLLDNARDSGGKALDETVFAVRERIRRAHRALCRGQT